MGYYWRFYENPNVLIQETYMQDESGYVVSPRPTLSGSCNMYIGDETGSNYNLEGQALWGRTVSDTNWLKVAQGGDVRTAYAYGDRMPASFSWEETSFKTATLSAWSCTQSVMLPYKTKTGHTQSIYKWSGGADAYMPGTWLQGNAPGENWYLYPTFTPNTYYVRFNANGGSGSMNNQTFTYNVAQALTANAFTYVGKIFKGWDANSAGTTVVYTDGQSVSNLSTTQDAIVNLYAVWEDIPSKFKVNVDGAWKTAKAQVNVGGTWKQAKVWNNINGTWKRIPTGGSINYRMSWNLTNCTSDSTPTTILPGEELLFTITPGSGYGLPEAITVVGASYVWQSWTIEHQLKIYDASGDVTVTIIATDEPPTCDCDDCEDMDCDCDDDCDCDTACDCDDDCWCDGCACDDEDCYCDGCWCDDEDCDCDDGCDDADE